MPANQELNRRERNRIELKRGLVLGGLIVAALALVSLTLGGCGSSASAERNQQTMRRMRALNDELRTAKEQRVTEQASPAARLTAPVTASQKQPEPDPSAQPTAVVDGSDPATPADTGDAQATGRDDSTASGPWQALARQLTEERQRLEALRREQTREIDRLRKQTTARLAEERRGWEVQRLRDEVRDLQEARLRDLLIWTRGGGQASSAGDETRSMLELNRAIAAMKAQQRQTDAALARLKAAEQQTTKSPAVDATTVPTRPTAREKALEAKLDALTRRLQTPTPDPAARKALEEERAELAKIRRELAREIGKLRDARTGAPKVTVVTPAPAPSPQPAAAGSSPAAMGSQAELDSQMLEAERMLQEKLKGQKEN